MKYNMLIGVKFWGSYNPPNKTVNFKIINKGLVSKSISDIWWLSPLIVVPL